MLFIWKILHSHWIDYPEDQRCLRYWVSLGEANENKIIVTVDFMDYSQCSFSLLKVADINPFRILRVLRYSKIKMSFCLKFKLVINIENYLNLLKYE